MVKRSLGLFLVALMLAPMSALAAPSTAELAHQIKLLTQQLEELKAQVSEVQDAADETADSVELLESSAEKWDNSSRFKFFGDYRFRMDYSDTDTKAYWDAGTIAGATNGMLLFNNGSGLPGATGGERNLNDYFNTIGLPENQRAAMATQMVKGAVAQMQGMTAAQRANAMKQMGLAMAPKDNYRNKSLYTNRFRLGMKVKASENIEFKGRLAMYKTWGMQSNPTSNGPYMMNQFAQMDGATTRQPNDSLLRVDRAYINWKNIAGLPIWFSLGRRPTTDGPPAHLRMGTGKRMATPINYMDYAFDGASLGMVFDNPFDFMGYSKIRFCYGRGFEAGPLEHSNNLDDMDFGGFSWDFINKGDRFANIQSFWAGNIINAPDGVDFPNPLELATGVGNGTLDKENLGDLYHTTFVYMDKVDNLHYFVTAGWSRTDPDGFDEMGSTLLGSWWDDPGQKDGYSVYTGIRYDFDDLGLKVGLEYNYGTKYWISMSPGHDDLTMSKLATRGHVGEIYAIYDLPVGELLNENCKAFMRLGYQHYEFNYTGSGNWLGAPVDVDDLDDPLNAQFFNPVDKMDQAYLTMEVWF